MEDIDALTRFDPMEQVQFEKEQNLYSIIKTIEFLEYAYMTGKVQGAAYDNEFRSLLHQYELCSQSIPNFVGLDAFIQQYSLEHCQSAKNLINKKASNYKGEELDRNLAQRVFDITTKFMQPLDMLSLNITSVDEILPPLRDVQNALSSYPQLPKDYQGLVNVTKWVD